MIERNVHGFLRIPIFTQTNVHKYMYIHMYILYILAYISTYVILFENETFYVNIR